MTRLEVVALPTARRFAPGDDLVAAVVEAAEAAGSPLVDGDVVCVASKVVAKVEGQHRALPAGEDPRRARRALAREVAARVVADHASVLVVETHHGFVCANAGIDASNADPSSVLLLPEDPDASAGRLQAGLRERLGVHVAVVVTDTFGRPWRLGQTDVALGVAGMAAVRDERGRTDLDGSVLEVTVAAVADEVAGVADLVRTKDAGTPFVLVRGLQASPDDTGTGAELVRSPSEDLFRHGLPTSTEAAVTSRRTIRAFVGDPIPRDVLERAVAAAATAPAPHHTRPWRFVDLADDTRTGLLDAMASAWREDLRRDGVDEGRIQRRLERSDAILRTAPTLLAVFVDLAEAHAYADERRAAAERDLFLLSAGAALQGLQVVLAAHGVGAAWISSTSFCPGTVRDHLHVPTTWAAVGMVACGRPAAPAEPRGAVGHAGVLFHR